MDGSELQGSDVVCGRPGVELTVEGVARLVDDRVSRLDLHDRWDRLVPAVVAGLRLIRELLRRIDRDHVLARHRLSQRTRTGIPGSPPCPTVHAEATGDVGSAACQGRRARPRPNRAARGTARAFPPSAPACGTG